MADGKDKEKEIDIKKVLITNPKVDPTVLAEGLAALRQLRESGLVKQPGYNIESPFSRPMQQVPDQDSIGKREGTKSSR